MIVKKSGPVPTSIISLKPTNFFKLKYYLFSTNITFNFPEVTGYSKSLRQFKSKNDGTYIDYMLLSIENILTF